MAAGSYSQTLARGVRALQILAAAPERMSIQQVAEGLGVHRSIAYRILRTLEDHRLVERDETNRYAPGVGLAALARTVKRSLQNAALPEMSDVASELQMTTFLVVPDRGDAVTVASVEPRHSQVHVAYRPGVRHPADRGAPGLALLAGGPPLRGERREVTRARARGWATSYQEVLPGMRSVAAPVGPVTGGAVPGGTVIDGTVVDGTGEVLAALAVVYVDSNVDLDKIGSRLVAGARAIEAELS